jgi:hypothetical protein
MFSEQSLQKPHPSDEDAWSNRKEFADAVSITREIREMRSDENW